MTASCRRYRFRAWNQHAWQNGDTGDTFALFLFKEGEGTDVENETSGGVTDAEITTESAIGWIPGPLGGAYDWNDEAIVVATHATEFDIGTGQDFSIDAVIRLDEEDLSSVNYIVRHANDYFIRFTGYRFDFNIRDHYAGGPFTMHKPGTSTDFFDLRDYNLFGQWFHLRFQLTNLWFLFHRFIK